MRLQLIEDPLQPMSGYREHSVVVKRPTAAERSLWHDDVVAGSLQDLKRGFRGFGMKIIVEGVGPQNHFGSAVATRIVFGGAPLKTLRGKGRYLPLRGDSCDKPHRFGEGRRLGKKVRQLRHPRGEAGPPVYQPKSVRRSGTEPAFVIVREKFRLVGRHIDVDRTIALAPFAGKAKIERLLDRFALPAAYYIALQHLEQQAGAPAGGVFFFPRYHEARTHGALVHAPAFADTDAAQRGVSEATVILRETKMSCRTRGAVVRSQPEIPIAGVSVDNFAWIHFP